MDCMVSSSGEHFSMNALGGLRGSERPDNNFIRMHRAVCMVLSSRRHFLLWMSRMVCMVSRFRRVLFRECFEWFAWF